VGVQLTAGPWQEARLISLCAQLEQATPWANRRSPLAAAA
jgi:Asp-tRNA(Asn)/Glu-tRNA(Gln) amidotransferase A subunit family amidase